MMTKETRNKFKALEKGSLLRDIIGYGATVLIGLGAGRLTIKEAKTEAAVSSLATEVAGIKTDVSSITAEVNTIKSNVDEIKTTQKDQDAKLDQILAAIKPTKTTTPAPTPTSAPAPGTPVPTATPKAPMPPKVPKSK